MKLECPLPRHKLKAATTVTHSSQTQRLGSRGELMDARRHSRAGTWAVEPGRVW